MRTTIELQIDELVLHGVAPGDRRLIAATLERELARLLGTAAIPEAKIAGRVDAGVFRMASDASAETIGAQVAQAVSASVNR